MNKSCRVRCVAACLQVKVHILRCTYWCTYCTSPLGFPSCRSLASGQDTAKRRFSMLQYRHQKLWLETSGTKSLELLRIKSSGSVHNVNFTCSRTKGRAPHAFSKGGRRRAVFPKRPLNTCTLSVLSGCAPSSHTLSSSALISGAGHTFSHPLIPLKAPAC